MNPVQIEVVIDRSGSMQSIAPDAVGGFNTWLDAQQKLPGEAQLTLSLFDHEHQDFPTANLAEVKPLVLGETYVPRGSTALNDAIGRALGRLTAKNPDKAILVILTDGQENSSHEFTTTQIKERITEAQTRGWQVVYLSADVNAFANAASIGVLGANTMQYTADAAGLTQAFASSTSLNAAYRAGNVDATLADTDTAKSS